MIALYTFKIIKRLSYRILFRIQLVNIHFFFFIGYLFINCFMYTNETSYSDKLFRRIVFFLYNYHFLINVFIIYIICKSLNRH